jgi:hypothetical protein
MEEAVTMPILHLMDTSAEPAGMMSEQALANKSQLEHHNDEVDADEGIEGIELHHKVDNATDTVQQNDEFLYDSESLEYKSCNQLQLEQDDKEEDADHDDEVNESGAVVTGYEFHLLLDFNASSLENVVVGVEFS